MTEPTEPLLPVTEPSPLETLAVDPARHVFEQKGGKCTICGKDEPFLLAEVLVNEPWHCIDCHREEPATDVPTAEEVEGTKWFARGKLVGGVLGWSIGDLLKLAGDAWLFMTAWNALLAVLGYLPTMLYPLAFSILLVVRSVLSFKAPALADLTLQPGEGVDLDVERKRAKDAIQHGLREVAVIWAMPRLLFLMTVLAAKWLWVR